MMSKARLLRDNDDSDDDNDSWFAHFNAATGTVAPESGGSLRPIKKTKKAIFLDDDEDEEDQCDEVSTLERGKKSPPRCANLFGSVNALTAERVLIDLSQSHNIEGHCSKSSTSQELIHHQHGNKVTDNSENSDHNLDKESLFGRATVCMSDEFRPVFDVDFKRADKTIHLRSPSQYREVDFLLNHHIARYLLDHQVDGIQWLWSKYLCGKGVILADDMGMGKTIQITALMSIIFCKTGVGLTDSSRMKLRRKQEALQTASSSSSSSSSIVGSVSVESPSVKYYLQTKPCLITCPKSLIDNWYKEIQKWGYFTVDILTSKLDEEEKETIMKRAEECRSEIVLVSYSQIGKFHTRLAEISWSMIVFDEGHLLKNPSINLYQQMIHIKKTTFRLVATGTPIQNDLLELWSILHLIDGSTFVNRQDFVKEYEKPIKLGMRSNADPESVAGGKEASQKLASLLQKYMLGRKKKLLEGGAVEIGNHEGQMDEKQILLKGKDEVIVLCDLSPIQRELYEHCLSLPDFDNIRNHTAMCPCGSSKTRGKCCPQYRIPYKRDENGNLLEPMAIDPRAALWSNFHQNNEPCGDDKHQRCPLCVLLPCLSILSKIACHPALLQYDPNAARSDKQEKLKRFVSNALTTELVRKMGGPQRSARFMDMKSTSLSGKMKTLQDMLEFFVKDGQRTLVFSLSTQVLDMIEALVKSRGWTSLRLDGQTQAHRRQKMVDQFNEKNDINIFLISSRAGGLGLNLCTATKVIIFDVDWNPVVDMQSQDRAYRIGQKEHLVVYRLVSKGTIEEMTYMRQLYKQQLQNAVPMWQSNSSSAGFKRGKFEGVEGDANMRGELFGIENLLQFSTGSILHALRNKYDGRKVVRKSFGSPESGQNGDIPGVHELKKLDIDEAMNLLVEDLNDANPHDLNKSSCGLELLQSMGINVNNAHRLDEMLEGRPDDDNDDDIDIFAGIGDEPLPINHKRSRTSKVVKQNKKKMFEVNYSSGPSGHLNSIAKDGDIIEIDLLEFDNQNAHSSKSKSTIKRKFQQEVVDLVENDDIAVAKEKEVGVVSGSSKGNPQSSSTLTPLSSQETTDEPKKLAEIFVRRVIKPKTDQGLAKNIRSINSAVASTDDNKETQPLILSSPKSNPNAMVNRDQKRTIPNMLSRSSLTKRTIPNPSVGLYVPKYQ